MGIIRYGILGGFRNKTGTVIGSSWRGKDVIKRLPTISEKPPTQEQLDQRMKFGIITSLLAWVSEVIEIGYGEDTQGPTSMNEAVSDNLAVAITGASPNFSVDPLKLVFSKGRLSLPVSYSVTTAVDAVLDFEWSKDTQDRMNHLTDWVHLLVYNPDKQKFVSKVKAAARSAEAYSMQLPLNWTGDIVHSYMCLSEPKGYSKSSTDTLYVGQSTVL